MVEKSKEERLNDLVERLFGQKPNPVYGKFSSPFDISRPNIHESKSDFLAEQSVVENVRAHLSGVMTELQDPKGANSREWSTMSFRLAVAIELSARNQKRPDWPKVPLDLVMQNLTHVGFYHSSLVVIAEMLQYFSERSQELKRQELEFWTVRSRPPNYYARTIALRFAKFYARQKGAKPTFGTSRDGGHPSTDFGRALEEVFQILEIKANLRRSAEWAVAELVEDDWQPKNALAGLLGQNGLGQFFNQNALGAIPSDEEDNGR